MEAGGRDVACRGSRSPLAFFKHGGLAVLADGDVTGLALIARCLGLALAPAQPLELQPLHGAAGGAGDMVAALVGGLVLPLDA